MRSGCPCLTSLAPCSAVRGPLGVPLGDALGRAWNPGLGVAMRGAARLCVFPGTEMQGAQPSGLARCSSNGDLGTKA